VSRPTCGPTAEEIAVVTAAARALMTARAAAPEVRDETPAWRFSGRWFGRDTR